MCTHYLDNLFFCEYFILAQFPTNAYCGTEFVPFSASILRIMRTVNTRYLDYLFLPAYSTLA